jgi:flagellar biosynthesis protein FlhF
MRVKKFTGKTMQEAVESLRCEYGADAIILHTVSKRRWLWGRVGPKRYEVVGAIDQSSNPPLPATKTRPERQEVAASVASQPETLRFDPSMSEAVQRLYGRLVRRDIPKDLVQGLLRDVLARLPKQDWNDEAAIWTRLCGLVAERVVTVDPWEFSGEQRIVVLIGPTGVGKTTTIAKIAANFSLIGAKNVGLITIDTYRIAAVEQLKTYAEIIGIPVQVAYSPKELKDALGRMQDRDLVLIDTAGRSHNNYLQISELKNYLAGIKAEIHLVISATTKPQDIDEIVKAFGQVSVDRVIITKLDETTTYGVILQTCERTRAPLSFVTTGQGVPEDIDVATDDKIAQLILGEAEI